MKLKHDDRSWNNLKKAGALMRLTKHALTSAIVQMDKCFPKKDSSKLNTALRLISEVCCIADDKAVDTFPEKEQETMCIFYGAINIEPRNETDKEVMEIARDFIKERYNEAT